MVGWLSDMSGLDKKTDIPCSGIIPNGGACIYIYLMYYHP